ncbi:MAG: polysaccharide deacetylase family protein [Bacteroidales bacterium]
MQYRIHFQTTLLLFIISVCVLLHQPTPLQAQNKGDHHINAFNYHRFGEDKYPSTNIDLKTFEQHLQFFQENDYTVLTLGEVIDKLKSKEDIPEKTVVLTVDDGYKSFKTEGVSLLEKYNYKATVFICTDYVGKNNYLSWDDIRELRQQGYEFGNHSHTHDHFLNYSDEQTREEFRRDLSQAEKIFQQQLGFKPRLYCYPYGEYNPDMQKILKKKGYRAAAAQKSGVIYSESDLFALPRFPMNSTYGKLEKFRSKARMKALPVIKEKPANTEIKNTNPPQLTLQFDATQINTDHIQCFINGRRACKISRQSNAHVTLQIQAEEKLQTRRTLYTITAPSKSGRDWYWYTHLWVNTEYGE